MGDCLCFASALQKIIDPDEKFTDVTCILKDPYGRIGHCMLHNLNWGYYYDADGEHDWEEAMEKFNDFTEECWDNLEDYCWEYTDYKDEILIPKHCDGKVEKIEEILREHPPEWLDAVM